MAGGGLGERCCPLVNSKLIRTQVSPPDLILSSPSSNWLFSPHHTVSKLQPLASLCPWTRVLLPQRLRGLLCISLLVKGACSALLCCPEKAGSPHAFLLLRGLAFG